ncbi:hypothetical protein KTQ42_15805|uniref:hypothetical protein n=1 Tax=Noviherbaspirillum sp. L7-7A TaxID=2850560 RepID=UPI001C2C3726|nr:hypothetical protein [Noviherbaspirillum sp. L7-7A]MBV0880761.1 hypothetical protein [Noviherbaspirillum sp. L7-7A]
MGLTPVQQNQTRHGFKAGYKLDCHYLVGGLSRLVEVAARWDILKNAWAEKARIAQQELVENALLDCCPSKRSASVAQSKNPRRLLAPGVF